jgi:hypothetical protein
MNPRIARCKQIRPNRLVYTLYNIFPEMFEVIESPKVNSLANRLVARLHSTTSTLSTFFTSNNCILDLLKLLLHVICQESVTSWTMAEMGKKP